MTLSPFARPLYVMLKPVGAHCNLACRYCYYLDKKLLYANEPRHILSEGLLEYFIQEYIGAQTTDEVLFTWHGGETFMRPLSFYRRAVELQRKHAGGISPIPYRPMAPSSPKSGPASSTMKGGL